MCKKLKNKTRKACFLFAYYTQKAIFAPQNLGSSSVFRNTYLPYAPPPIALHHLIPPSVATVALSNSRPIFCQGGSGVRAEGGGGSRKRARGDDYEDRDEQDRSSFLVERRVGGDRGGARAEKKARPPGGGGGGSSTSSGERVQRVFLLVFCLSFYLCVFVEVGEGILYR